MKKNNTVGANYYKQAPIPQAWIAVSNNRQKIYGTNQVYLDSEQEFQIELYNPTSIKYLAKISINGKLISYSGLVLNPGQRYFLDRFIDEDKKLLFSTYEVESGNEEVKKAIAQNGLVKVEFYAEDTTPNWYNGISWTTTTNTYTTPTYYTQGNPMIYTTNGLSNIVGSGSSTTLNSYFSNASSTTAGSGATYTSTYNASNNLGGVLRSSSAKSQSASLDNVQCFASLGNESTKMMETGRVEKGSKSNQTFGSDYSKYNWAASYTSEYHILPRSVKPVEVSEIRSYCPGCRTRVKKKTWKFCPNCGEDLG